MRWWWQKREREPSEDPELVAAKAKAEQLVRRTQRLLRENNLGSDIKRALGGGSYR